MSKIKAVDFAKYVENAKNYGKDILKSKGVKVEDNKSLSYYIEHTNDLPDKEEEYQHDSYFAKIIEDYENDPLLQRNGGQYAGCAYYVIRAMYDTSFVPSTSLWSDTLLKTSDGQEIILPKENYTITWDKTKEGSDF